MASHKQHTGGWTVGEALRIALKQEGGTSLRSLAKRSGISAAQLSRLRADEVDRPSPRTLVALARALDRNPTPLMIVAGVIGGDEARRSLIDLLEHGTELAEEWATGGDDVEASRSLLRDPKTPDEQIQKIAFDAFLTESAETTWTDSFEPLGTEAEGSPELRELINLWALTPGAERRLRILDCARDQAQLSQLELQWDIHAAGNGEIDSDRTGAADDDSE